MSRTTLEEKRAAVKLLSTPGRPIREIAKMKKGNESPDYNGETLLARSKRTARIRAKQYNIVLREMPAAK